MILLDTCGLLSLQSGGAEHSSAARTQLEAPGSRVFVSAISAFEIGQKLAVGKLMLPSEPGSWFQAMLLHHQIEEIPMSSDIAIAATTLPGIHRDPFDRIIIATALALDLCILTSDRIIPTYPGVQTLW